MRLTKEEIQTAKDNAILVDLLARQLNTTRENVSERLKALVSDVKSAKKEKIVLVNTLNERASQ